MRSVIGEPRPSMLLAGDSTRSEGRARRGGGLASPGRGTAGPSGRPSPRGPPEGARFRAGRSTLGRSRRGRPGTSARRLFRFSFIDGVRSPPSSVRSAGRMVHFFTCSQLATSLLTSSMNGRDELTDLLRGGELGVALSPRPFWRAPRPDRLLVSVSSIVQKFRLLPCTSDLADVRAGDLELPLEAAGATYLPPDVLIRSFLRSVIRRSPSSTSPMSPVCSQPSGIEGLARRVGQVVVPAHHPAARMRISPSSAIRIRVPAAAPDRAEAELARAVHEVAALVSVSP